MIEGAAIGFSFASHSASISDTYRFTNAKVSNAACEGFFGRLKNELFYPRSWQSTTIEDFIAEVDSYIHWYNGERIKISLGSRSPMEYRADLGYAT